MACAWAINMIIHFPVDYPASDPVFLILPEKVQDTASGGASDV
jgi:hypothetical protein